MAKLKTVELTKREIEALLEVFTRAGGIQRTPYEEPETHQKFKYAMGRNYDAVRSAVDRIEFQISALRQYPEGWDAYRKKYEHLGQEYCQRDENGKPVIDHSDPDRPKYQFETKETHQQYKDAVDALRREYADVMAFMESQEERIAKVWDEMDRVDLYTIPFAWIPERIHGGYIYALRHVIRDLPTDLELTETEIADEESVL